jgi:UTP-glucose-1-phosphate uridylyltransferase
VIKMVLTAAGRGTRLLPFTKEMPKEIDFNFEENVDNTTASQELACTAGVCEI